MFFFQGFFFVLGAAAAIPVIYLIAYIMAGDKLKDPTDPPKGRSGLSLKIDAETGVHYLSTGMFGGLTPRLKPDGSLYVEPPQK